MILTAGKTEPNGPVFIDTTGVTSEPEENSAQHQCSGCCSSHATRIPRSQSLIQLRVLWCTNHPLSMAGKKLCLRLRRRQKTNLLFLLLHRPPTIHTQETSLLLILIVNEERSARKVVIDDFEMMRVLGKGCAGKVLLVRTNPLQTFSL